MLIPLIDKDQNANDFTCRDGEIEGVWYVGEDNISDNGIPPASHPVNSVSISLIAHGTYPTANIRIPLSSGDKEKANLLLTGEHSRVDPATSDRLTQAILQKAAEALLDISTDLRRQGLFILPFRFFTMTMTPEGTLTYPTPQGVALPSDFPPHPEIVAASATDDALTLSLRFPVRPHRLSITTSDNFPAGHSIRCFISYPLYIPDPKEMRGSIGSVRSASGGNAVGVRFAFLSSSALKASVAAPEKYYEFVGNERTGYRFSSKMSSLPDYSCYADLYGYVPVFPRASLLALGADADETTDPMDWIADWEKTGEGYLPAALPYKYRDIASSDTSGENVSMPEGIDYNNLKEQATSLGMSWILLTRPMALANESLSRRKAKPRSIRRIGLHGLRETNAIAVLYGSNDCRHWESLRIFDVRQPCHIFTPSRHWWRLMLFGDRPFPPAAIDISTS